MLRVLSGVARRAADGSAAGEEAVGPALVTTTITSSTAITRCVCAACAGLCNLLAALACQLSRAPHPSRSSEQALRRTHARPHLHARPHTPHHTRHTGLTEVLTTGGIPPGVDQPCSADAVYASLFPRVVAQNERYYARFPGDVARVQRIVQFLASQPGGGLQLPSGSRLTPRALQLLGLSGLGSGGERCTAPGCRPRRQLACAINVAAGDTCAFWCRAGVMQD